MPDQKNEKQSVSQDERSKDEKELTQEEMEKVVGGGNDEDWVKPGDVGVNLDASGPEIREFPNSIG